MSNGGVARWGDYSAAVADDDGNIWIATEYIGQTCTDAQYSADLTCNKTRSQLANWGTFIGKLPTCRAADGDGDLPGRNGGSAHFHVHEDRSEEHTSELQSRLHLVCRLLLEKKKNITVT